VLWEAVKGEEHRRVGRRLDETAECGQTNGRVVGGW
jgi:hypothetical protein